MQERDIGMTTDKTLCNMYSSLSFNGKRDLFAFIDSSMSNKKAGWAKKHYNNSFKRALYSDILE